MIIEFDRDKILSDIQKEVFDNNSRFKVCAWGRRAGKSYLSTYILITEALKKPDQLFFFIAPTFSQARAILWETIKDKTRNGLAKNINESRLEITLINGSRILLKSAEKPDTLRGVSLDGVVFDEFASMRSNEEVWIKVVRPALSDKEGWALFISSPAGRNYFYDLYNSSKSKEGWAGWQRTTLDGGNVKEDEVITARRELDERSFRQEYEASFESYEGLVAPNFDRELNKSTEEINEYDTLIMGVDFNINKMPCSVSIKRGHELHTVDEFYGSFNTDELMEAIEQRYPNHKKIFHTDASGSANKSSAGGRTDLDIIRNYGYNVMNLSRNPNVIDRVNASNSLICSVDKTRKWFVHERCKRIIETFEKHCFDDNGMPNKKHEYFDDVYDSVSYSQWHYSDFGKNKIKPAGLNFL